MIYAGNGYFPNFRGKINIKILSSAVGHRCRAFARRGRCLAVNIKNRFTTASRVVADEDGRYGRPVSTTYSRLTAAETVGRLYIIIISP